MTQKGWNSQGNIEAEAEAQRKREEKRQAEEEANRKVRLFVTIDHLEVREG